MDLYEELFLVVDALADARIDYALCGGLALAVHGHARATVDIDLIVRQEDLLEIERVVRAKGFTLPGGELLLRLGATEEMRAYRVSKRIDHELVTLDLLLLHPSLEEVWRTREVFVVDGRRLTVVSRTGLVHMKRLSRRRQDLADLERLGAPIDEPPES